MIHSLWSCIVWLKDVIFEVGVQMQIYCLFLNVLVWSIVQTPVKPGCVHWKHTHISVGRRRRHEQRFYFTVLMSRTSPYRCFDNPVSGAFHGNAHVCVRCSGLFVHPPGSRSALLPGARRSGPRSLRQVNTLPIIHPQRCISSWSD